MAHCNSAVHDVGGLDQVMIEAAWQKPRHPYDFFFLIEQLWAQGIELDKG